MQAQGKFKEIQDLRKQEASRQQRILRAKEELAAAESELKDLTSYEPPTAEIVCHNLSLKFCFSFF